MRLLCLELKRLVKTRSTWMLLAAALILSAVLAYFPISFVTSYKTDARGNMVKLTGIEAIQNKKEQEQAIAGLITEEKVAKAVKDFRECYQEYGSAFPPEVPMEVYNEKIAPQYPVLERAARVLADSQVYVDTMTDADISPEDVAGFYEKYRERLKQMGKDEKEQEEIERLSADIETPFTYVPGFSAESYDYLVLYLFLLMFIFAVIAAPVFCAEYQTGADSILRCARHGRMRLAATKIGAMLIIFLATFGAGTAVFLLITNQAFGWEGLQTSLQMLRSAFVMPQMTLGEAWTTVVLAGLCSLLATVCAALYLSSRCRNVQAAIIGSIVLCMLPTIIYMVSSSNVADILRCIFPSGGIGLTNSFFYEVMGLHFIRLGTGYIWTPHLIMGAAILEIPLFLVLTAVTYCRRESI